MDAPRSSAVCQLPGGYLDDRGRCQRDAELRPLSGREEELLASLAGEAPAVRITRLLCQCVVRIGTLAPVTAEVAGGLLVADRQYLLLKLRELTFGERVEGTLHCPWPRCGAKVDMDFSLRDIPVYRCDSVAASYPLELSAEAAVILADGTPHRRLRFRLPNGTDQEALGTILAGNPGEALTGLLARCVTSEQVTVADLATRLSPRARLEIERTMEATGPRLDLEMDLSCPECGRGFTAPFDIQDFFFGELRTSRDLLYRQVHYLAYHYHWSEAEILALPREKRMTYIEILAEEMEALNHDL